MTHVHPTIPGCAVKRPCRFVDNAALRTPPPPPPEPPGRDRGAWVVRVPLAALDHRSNGGLGHRKLGLLFVLETYCRARAYCWAGDLELAAAFGCRRGALSGLLRELEDDGWIRRVRPPKGQPGRVGILMLKRLDPDLPTAGPEGLADVVARLEEATEGRDRVQETGRDRVPFPERDRVQETGRRRRTNPKEDENVQRRLAPGGGDRTPGAVPDPIEAPHAEAAPGPVAPPRPPEVSDSTPAVAEVTPAVLADQGPTPEAESDPAPAPEQVEAELAELEAKQARQAPRPLGAMDRIRLANLRARRDGTWKADPLAGGASPAPPIETPRLASWPTAVGPVETSDLIRRLAVPGAGPEAVEAAAVRVADRLADSHSVGFYRKAFRRVQAGEVPVARALSAWRMARSGTAHCPGSVFVAAMKGRPPMSNTPPLRRGKPLSATEGPRPPRRGAPPPAEPESPWTEAKANAILDAFRSFVGNAALKHGVPPSEVADLVRDHLMDPD